MNCPEKKQLSFSSKLILFLIFTVASAYNIIDLSDEDYDYSGEEDYYDSETNSKVRRPVTEE